MSRSDRDAWLDRFERDASAYFRHEVDERTGLVRDNSRADAPASIAGSGFALSCYAVAAKRGYLGRNDAADRALRALRFLVTAPQGEGEGTIGAHGFFYHFLDMRTGERVWDCEVSTIDSTILFAGALFAAVYFDRDDEAEGEIRSLVAELYLRADWEWAFDGGPMVALGWHPERGFSRYEWGGYTEALILYVLALGSPSHPLPSSSYQAWTEGYVWRTLYDHQFLYAGPLFIHQLSHGWIDFRDIRDPYMKAHGIDYFENSRRATLVQRAYAIDNPRGFSGYGADCWGITASDGPGPATVARDGTVREFWSYRERGVPDGPDDGTVSPWALMASLPFAPEIVMSSIEKVADHHPELQRKYGFACSFNPTFAGTDGSNAGWVSPAHYAINQGPVVLMVENYRSELIWRSMRRCPYIVDGLRRAGFEGGWLDGLSRAETPDRER
ncbi:MAG: glucoamylase family protein [Gemmatimonadales bacterium]